MNYAETEAFLFSQLPAFQRDGKTALKPGLKNIEALLQILGNPHKHLKLIHIAGTNGKGSCSHMIASILQSEGYKTGLYTSPHLKSFRERIKINGTMIPEESVVNFVSTYWELFQDIKPSFFEITVALAFDFFKKEQVDIAVIEVGLGGRLDSTNVITPIASLITNIGLDHTDILGNTLEAIAKEKAGIIKENIPVVISEYDDITAEVFKTKAEELEAPIFFAKDYFKVEKVTRKETLTNYIVDDSSKNNRLEIALDLNGSYQSKNILGVLTLCKIINETTPFSISVNSIIAGLSKVIKLTGLKGRWQTLHQEPLTICDTGHNVHAFTELMQFIKELNAGEIHMILGFSKDKDLKGILPLLPTGALYYISGYNSFRSSDSEHLKTEFVNANLKVVNIFNNINEAFKSVLSRAKKNDFIFIGGSTYLVAELNQL